VKETLFVIGGCRSGKSRYALKNAERYAGGHKIFIATCEPGDAEMKNRVAQHQKERGRKWQTIEAPLRLAETIMENSHKADVLLVDCLTLWITNLMMVAGNEETVAAHIAELLRAIDSAECPMVLVSNEVGTGIVPDNKLARSFRDLVGFANQAVAAGVDRVIWMVAGIPVTVKG